MLRDHGQPKKYYHDLIGWNGRMDGIQGAVLSVKLKHLTEWNEARRNKARLYDELLAENDNIIPPQVPEYAKHVYHIYAIRVQSRDKIMNALAEKGIGCGIHYPVPIHLQKAMEFLGCRTGDFPETEKVVEEILSLPMFAEITDEQISSVSKAIRAFYTT